jgi:AbrB family looped-hinge helix DNA binding protein
MPCPTPTEVLSYKRLTQGLAMATTLLSSKGQVVIPKELRDRLGWAAGTSLDVEEGAGGLVLRPSRRPARLALADLVGCTGYQGPARSLEDMAAGIAEGARRSR